MGNIASWAVGVLGQAVDKTPGMGGIRRWTQDTATNSKAAREPLRLVVYTCIACMIFTLGMAFKIILEGKMDAVAAGVVTGSFTLFGGILAVTIPAFVTALNATDVPMAVTPVPTVVTAPADPPTDPK